MNVEDITFTGIVIDKDLLRCSKCKELKHEDLFSRDTRYKRNKVSWCKQCMREYHLKLPVNGLSREDFEGMRWLQDNKCALCECYMTDGWPQIKTSITVDHDHRCCKGTKSCGKCIRGLLCRGCNSRLGIYEYFSRNPLLKDYLERVM